MAINPNIPLQGQPVNLQQAIMGGLQTGQAIRQMGIQDALLRQQQQMGQMQLAQGQQNLATARATTVNTVARQLAQTPLDQRAGVLARMMPTLQQAGIDPNAISADDLSDQALMQAIQSTQPFVPAGGQGFTLSENQVRYDAQGRPIAANMAAPEPDENLNKIREETRSELRGTVGTLRKDAGVLRTNYEKLQNLADEMRGGNRTAVSQGLVALVKLGDPTSVVREAEMEAALNKQNPIAAVTQLLAGKETPTGVIDSVVQKIDPLSPQNINVDDVLATANAMMVPNIQQIGQSFEVARAQADDAGLTQEGIQSIFGDRTVKLFEDLGAIGGRIEAEAAARQQAQQPQQQAAPQAPAQQQGVVMQHPTLGDITEADIQQTMQANNMTREQVLQRLQGAQ